jgi:hypothetical protein
MPHAKALVRAGPGRPRAQKSRSTDDIPSTAVRLGFLNAAGYLGSSGAFDRDKPTDVIRELSQPHTRVVGQPLAAGRHLTSTGQSRIRVVPSAVFPEPSGCTNRQPHQSRLAGMLPPRLSHPQVVLIPKGLHADSNCVKPRTGRRIGWPAERPGRCRRVPNCGRRIECGLRADPCAWSHVGGEEHPPDRRQQHNLSRPTCRRLTRT